MRRRLKNISKHTKRLLIIFAVAAALIFLSFNGYILVTAECRPQTGIETLPVSTDAASIQNALVEPFSGMSQGADSPSIIETRADSFNLPLAQDALASLYTNPSTLLRQGATVQFNLTVPSDGEYTLAFDVAVPAESVLPEGQLSIDGAFPVSALQRFTFPIYYRNDSSSFSIDRYGNDALIRQVRDVHWTSAPIWDMNFSDAYPIRVNLSAGEHQFSFTLTSGELYVGSVYLLAFAPYPSYAEYQARYSEQETADYLLSIEAELPAYKNDTSVRPENSRNLSITPYDTYCLLLNTLGGESWKKSGTAVYYEINVPEDGLYVISLRIQQNTRSNFTVFRRITINGEVPFAELNAVAFPYSPNWETMQLGGETPYRIFLHQGTNVLSIEASSAQYLPAIETIQDALFEINTLALEIRRLTGNQSDRNREWLISDYIPDIEERLRAIAQNLIDDKNTLLSDDSERASPESLNYQMAIDNLLFLADNTNEIPIYMSRFSEGTGSAAQLLGSLVPLLQSQPLALDTIFIHSPNVTPETPVVLFTSALFEYYKRFLYSFKPSPYQASSTNEDELVVWVNRPRQYVNLLQLMADTSFTPETGIQVRFSIMPDESKLVLANAAGIQPDVALGVSTNVPYELAIRNALYDLRSFEDFDEFIQIYSPGSLLGYIINDSLYALPETQDFWVTYYRRDILDSLSIPVPDTWDEVIEILPELQRYGMNYNTPLSTGSGQKNYLLTAPYLFNYGADLYSEDGFATGLQSDAAIDAINFMADSFTIYGMPLTTANFYQDFRYGTIPIGVSNAETYIKLSTIAPEINGLWDIDLFPATVLPDGTQNRYATGSAQTSIIFQNTDRPDEAWAFLTWWMSTETQTEFQEQLILNYGQDYLWFSANLDAFANLPIPEEHRTTILEQWQWLQEPVRLPGSYMQERELSNIWNRVVFDGVNPRVAIDRAVIIINREITRKMEEFGYLEDGQEVREFTIPTIETVIGWMQDGD